MQVYLSGEVEIYGIPLHDDRCWIDHELDHICIFIYTRQIMEWRMQLQRPGCYSGIYGAFSEDAFLNLQVIIYCLSHQSNAKLALW